MSLDVCFGFVIIVALVDAQDEAGLRTITFTHVGISVLVAVSHIFLFLKSRTVIQAGIQVSKIELGSDELGCSFNVVYNET